MWSPSDIVIGFGSSNWGAMNPMRPMTAAVGTIALKNLETTYLSWNKKSYFLVAWEQMDLVDSQN